MSQSFVSAENFFRSRDASTRPVVLVILSHFSPTMDLCVRSRDQTRRICQPSDKHFFPILSFRRHIFLPKAYPPFFSEGPIPKERLQGHQSRLLDSIKTFLALPVELGPSFFDML